MFHLGGGGFDLQGHGVTDAYMYSDFSSHDFSLGGQNCCPKISLLEVAGDPASLEVCNCGIAKSVVEHVDRPDLGLHSCVIRWRLYSDYSALHFA